MCSHSNYWASKEIRKANQEKRKKGEKDDKKRK